jgi:hypothetical protein
MKIKESVIVAIQETEIEAGIKEKIIKTVRG